MSDRPTPTTDARAEDLTRTLREVNEALFMAALREQAVADEARAESEAKSVFLASVSHELRTPLNSVLGYADLLHAGVPEPLPESLRRHVDRIQVAVRHLLSLIEQIIEASRAEFDNRIRSERFDVGELMHELAELVRPRAADKGLRLDVEIGEGSFEVTGDRKKLRQVVLNLLVNAIKFTDEGGVTLVLEREGPHAQIQVVDTGIGIPEDHQANVFRRFWQVDGGSPRSEGGMGIGLWVVRTLVEAMDGEIELRSIPGHGSTFEVRFPAGSPPS